MSKKITKDQEKQVDFLINGFVIFSLLTNVGLLYRYFVNIALAAYTHQNNNQSLIFFWAVFFLLEFTALYFVWKRKVWGIYFYFLMQIVYIVTNMLIIHTYYPHSNPLIALFNINFIASFVFICMILMSLKYIHKIK